MSFNNNKYNYDFLLAKQADTKKQGAVENMNQPVRARFSACPSLVQINSSYTGKSKVALCLKEVKSKKREQYTGR
jgi:hypothetical protein